MSRYLVTGATGFLGLHLVRALRSHGHDVVALCRSEAPLGGALAALGVTVQPGDVLDARSVHDAAIGCDGVFHCAGKVSRDPRDAESLHELHVVGTRTVLAACKDAEVRRAVVASTSGTVAVSEDPSHVATEDDETPIGLIAAWPYYRSKLFAERAALAMNDATFEVIAVCPSLLLGPGDTRGSSTDDVRLFLDRKIPAVPSGGISYVDARDAAEALRLAMLRGTPGSRYLIGASNVTMREFFARLERVSGVKGPWVPAPARFTKLAGGLLDRALAKVGVPPLVDPVSLAMAQCYWYVDATRAERDLGWKPRDPVATLADTVDDLRSRGVVWPTVEAAT